MNCSHEHTLVPDVVLDRLRILASREDAHKHDKRRQQGALPGLSVEQVLFLNIKPFAVLYRANGCPIESTGTPD